MCFFVGGDGIEARSLEVWEVDEMESRLGEDGGGWRRMEDNGGGGTWPSHMCNCGLWLNLIFLRDRLIRKVFRLPVDDAWSIYM